MGVDISIIIPVYNTEKYLRECLDSVINQTFKNIEIICVNDGSTDNSLEVLKEYAQKDKRIVIKQQENKKVAAARNNGYKSATGKYVYFLDSDDYLYRNNALEIIYNELETQHADVAVWGILELIDEKFIESHTIHKIRAYYNNPENFNFISLNTSTTYKMFRKKFLDAHGITFPEKITHSEDTLFSLESHFNKPKYVFINDTLHVYRRHNCSATWKNIHTNTNIFKAIKQLESKEIYQKQPIETKMQVVENWLKAVMHYYNTSYKTTYEQETVKDIIKYFSNIYDKKELEKLQIYKNLLKDYIIKDKKVSIILPVYNAEKTISRCLDALISQSYQNFEIICVNDGSKDNSLDILQKYANNDKRILSFSQNNSGPAKTRNFAMNKATGTYIMFCDADDWYEKTMIEKMVTSIEEHNADIVMCNCNLKVVSKKELTTEDTKKWHKLKLKGEQDININTIKQINTMLWNKILKKELIDKYNIEYPMKYEYDDNIFIWKYLTVCNKYYGITENLYNYSIDNPNSIIGKVYLRKNKERKFDFIYAYKDIYDFLEKNHTKEEYINLFYNLFFVKIKFFYNLLSRKDKKNCRKILLLFLKENKKLLKHEMFNKLYNTKNFKEFNALLFLNNPHNNLMGTLRKIFAVTNKNNHKIINILGIKIKFKYKRKQKPLNTVKKFIKSYFLFPWYTYQTYKKINKIQPIIIQQPPQLYKEKTERKLEYYSVPHIPLSSGYKQLICTTGFGHSGSGAVLDYLAEFSNVTTYGYHDANSTGYTKKNDYGEIDIFRAAGSVMDMEKSFNYSNYFNDDLTIKYFLTVAEFFYRKGYIYNDYFWKLTKEFVNNITDIKIKTNNGFEGLYFLQFLSPQKEYTNLKSPILKDAYLNDRYIYYLKNLTILEYRKIAKEYITKFLKSIESKEFLVCDQMLTTSKPETERKIDYFGDFKQICVYRDPRDIYVTGINLNEGWMPHNPVDFVKWFYHRGTPAYLDAPPHPNRLMIRFEDFVLKYDETSKIINDFVGISEKDHIHKKEYFNPAISINNIGLYKNYENQQEIIYIQKELQKYCYE